MRRWLVRITLAALLLAALAAAGIQLVLWSDYPRQRLIQTVEQKTGLKITVGAMRTSWAGRSTLHNVSIGLPLEPQSVLEMPRLVAGHTSVFSLLLGRGFELHSLDAMTASANVARIDGDEWNIARVVQTVRERMQQDTGGQAAALPRIAVQQLDIALVGHSGDTAQYAASFAGTPESGGVWSFKIEEPSLGHVTGRVAAASPGQPHQVSFELTGLDGLLRQFLEDQPWVSSAIDVNGEWRGEFKNGHLVGHVDLKQAAAQGMTLSGEAAIDAAADALTLSDFDFAATTRHARLERVKMTGGTVRVDHSAAAFGRVRIEIPSASATVDGRWSRVGRAGELQVAWDGHETQWELVHRGEAEIAIQFFASGERRIAVKTHASGSLPAGDWSGEFTASAQGRSWTSLEGRFDWPAMIWRDAARHVDLSGLVATWHTAWPVVHLDEMRLPQANMTAHGQIDLDAMVWSAEAQATAVTLPIATTQPSDLQVKLSGHRDRVLISDLRVRNQALQVQAAGTYTPAAARPLELAATITAKHPFQDHADGDPAQGQCDEGAWRGQVSMRGQVQPLDLHIEGQADGRCIPVGDAMLAAVSAPIHGRITSDRLSFNASEILAFDGHWTISGDYDLNSRNLLLDANAKGVSLSSVSSIVTRPIADGELSVDLRVRLPDLDVQQLELSGDWSAVNVRSAVGSAATGTGRLQAVEGLVSLRDLRLESSEGGGVLTGSAHYRPQTHVLAIDINAQGWPVQLRRANADLIVGGAATLEIDITKRAATGTGDVAVGVSHAGQLIGTVQAVGRVNDRTIDLASIRAEIFDGQVEGNAIIPLDQLAQTSGQLSWEGVDCARIASMWPRAAVVQGRVAGSAVITPASGAQPLEPSRIDLLLKRTDLTLAGIELGEAELTAYLGSRRLIIDQSRFAFADGEIELWGRLTQHDDQPFAHVQATFQRLDFNALAHAVAPENDEQYPGRLGGSIIAGGSLVRPHRMFGQAELSLTESDLGDVPIVSMIYEALDKGGRGGQPRGEGSATARLEGDALEFTRIEYFNRGADVIAHVRIADLWAGGRSPIQGVAFGAVRPLKSLTIPFFSDLDRAMKALQSDVYSMRIEGTVENHTVRPVPFAEISSTLRGILTGSSR